MWELKIQELLITLFLLLPLIRPFIKNLRAIDGLAWLPLPALGICVGIFPAYGFRPECIPLLLYGIIINCINAPALISMIQGLKNDDIYERRPVYTGIALGLLFAVSGTALYFSPSPDIILSSRGIGTGLIQDENRGGEFFLRVYQPEDSEGPQVPAAGRRPLMLLIPPVAGSVMLIDGICRALAERGFTVMTYSRRGFDSPAVDGTGKRRGISPVKNFRLLRAITRGRKSAAANAIGRMLEEERGKDIEFLLSSIRKNGMVRDLILSDTDLEYIFLTGYGAGGAALTVLSGSPEFVKNNPAVKGIIAVEGPLLSALQGVPRKTTPAAGDSKRIRLLWTDLTNRIAGLGPQKITGMADLPRPEIPILFILSGGILNSRYRDERYGTILGSFRTAPAPALLAAVPGAGPADYSDGPEKYPFLRVFFHGHGEPVWQNREFIPGTASLMANFAAALPAPADGEPWGGSPRRIMPPRRTRLKGDLYVEANGAWNSPDTGYILGL
jgi:dienelactone hydrolase